MPHIPRTLAFCTLASLTASTVLAQQFSYQPGLIPGSVWTEGVATVDVDGDGDLDVLVADGDGFAGPGAQRQNRLYINQFVQTGTLSFVDESTSRLGTSLSHARGIACGDVDGDGWVDILFANGFNTQPPYLFINRGAAQPGFFDQESAQRGLTENLNSAGAQFGDVDDDGDLDLVICDSGQAYLGGAGDEPRLYRNDGQGNFTWDMSAIPGPAKDSQMDINLVDVDGDFDLDLFVPCRGSNPGNNHYLMLNDGTGQFTDASSTLPNTSTSVYEAEVGDLDGDTDVDLFFVSLNGFREGHVENRIEPTGNLSFTAGAPQPTAVDDNEIVLIDYDTDGDYDVLVGSLSNRESMYRNDGNLTWSNANAQIQAVGDSTLDATAADFDNDGDYDILTGQGESNPGQYVNKVYINSGGPDTLAPVVVATDFQTAEHQGFPLSLHARVQDQVIDDGVNYVTARGWAAPAGGSSPTVTYSGFSLTPSSVTIRPGESILAFNQASGPATFDFAGPVSNTLDVMSNSTYERVFVAPGTYTLTVGQNSMTINVAGPVTQVEGLSMGGQQFRFEVPQLNLGGDTFFFFDSVYRDWPGNEFGLHNQTIEIPLGSAFCEPAGVNSTSQPASLSFEGSPVASANALTLLATQLPTNQFGYFLTSMSSGPPVQPAGSAGTICLGSPIGRYNASVMNSGASGEFTLPIDLTSMPLTPAVPAVAGQTWYFQAWYRDVVIFPTSNFTSGRSLLLQ